MIIKSLYELGEIITNNILYGYNLYHVYDFVSAYPGHDLTLQNTVPLYKNNVIQMNLLCLDENQSIELSQYSKKGVLVKVLSGCVEEEVYKRDIGEMYSDFELYENDCSFISKHHIVKYNGIQPSFLLLIFSAQDSTIHR